MLSVSIQFLLLSSAMLVNFVIPAVYGLESFGSFIQANVLVFLVQRLSDLLTEPLISRVPSASVFPLALLLSAVFWITFVIADNIFAIGSISLLGAMLLSSCVMLSMHALALRKHMVVYLIVFLGEFIVLMVSTEAGFTVLSIRDILFWTNLVPSAGASILIVRRGVLMPKGDDLKSLLLVIVRMIPVNFSISLVFNLFTNLLPYIFAQSLPLVDVGLFRVMTALIQSATVVFPINTKTIFVNLVKTDKKNDYINFIIFWSLLYFAFLGLGAIVVAGIRSNFVPYIALVASLPTLYWVVLMERYLQAVGRRGPLIAANLQIAAVVLLGALYVDSVELAAYCYAIGLALYATYLLFINRHILPVVKMAPIVLISPVVVWLQNCDLLYTAIYFIGVIIFFGITFTPDKHDIRRLRVHR